MITAEHLLKEDMLVGDNIEEAIYILADGSLMDGGFDCGIRSVEHRELELFTEAQRQTEDYWKEIILGLQVVMLIPETSQVLIMDGQELTIEQQDRIAEATDRGYTITDFD